MLLGSVNDQPPRVMQSDPELELLRVVCRRCGGVVARARMWDTRKRGQPPVLAIMAQHVTDKNARPVATSVVPYVLETLRENDDMYGECVVHGQLFIPRTEAVQRLARLVARKMMPGADEAQEERLPTWRL